MEVHEDEVYVVKELAQILKVATGTAYRLLGQNKIEHIRIGDGKKAQYRITGKAIKKFLGEGNDETTNS